MKALLKFKYLLFKVKIFFANAYDLPQIYSEHYGVTFGKNVRITGKKVSFGGEPFLVEIGSNVTITPGVKFQTHDGGVGLFRKDFPGINVMGRIKVGDNVFIGEDVMIMYGVTIGNNVVIGARSVVTKNIPDNSVAVGIPARVIKSIDEYKKSSLEKGIYVFSNHSTSRQFEILQQIDKNESTIHN